MKNIKKTLLTLALLTLATSILSGCSNNSSNEETPLATTTPAVEDDSSNEETDSSLEEDNTQSDTDSAQETTYPLTIKNYSITDGTWLDSEQTFAAVPQRIVASTQPTAELLIRLGLTDKMVGVAALYGESPEDIAADFDKIPVLSTGYVGKELVLGASPDLVIGRWDLFADAEWGVGTVKELNSMGINTYIQNTCRQGATLEDLYKDIEELGELFSVQENAAAFSDIIRNREEQLKERLLGVEDTLKYAYVFEVTDGAVSVYSGSTDTYQNDALNIIKLDNAFGDVSGEINLEQFIATDPDVLLITYYAGGPDIAKTVEELYSIPSIQSMTAIKNKQVYIIDYNQFWSYGYQIFDGVEQLATEIYPDLFTTN